VKGKVKWFNDRKGYGFIEKEDGNGDVFVPHPAITPDGLRTLAEGQEVEFEVIQDQRGEKAINVMPL